MGAHGTKVAVVPDSSDKETKATYSMYEACDLTRDGFFLAGPLFLEVDEELTVELSKNGDSSVRARVRVERVDEDGARPGMAVKFAELSAPDRKKLEGILGARDDG